MRRLERRLAMSLAVFFTVPGLSLSYWKIFMYARASLVRTCISPTMPAQATPTLSVILNTFLAPLLMTKVPYAYRRSDASRTPSLQTMPIVVAPGIQRSSLKRKDGGHSPHVALKLATRG